MLVVTLALAGGPLAGTVIGFGAGLALDIAPPSAGLLGLNALVFCAIGYGCGRLRGPMERAGWLPLAVIAAATAAGEIMYALVGLTLGDPDISWQSMRQVLPPVIVYSILISPFVLYLVVRFSGFGGWASAGGRERPCSPAPGWPGWGCSGRRPWARPRWARRCGTPGAAGNRGCAAAAGWPAPPSAARWGRAGPTPRPGRCTCGSVPPAGVTASWPDRRDGAS